MLYILFTTHTAVISEFFRKTCGGVGDAAEQQHVARRRGTVWRRAAATNDAMDREPVANDRADRSPGEHRGGGNAAARVCGWTDAR